MKRWKLLQNFYLVIGSVSCHSVLLLDDAADWAQLRHLISAKVLLLEERKLLLIGIYSFHQPSWEENPKVWGHL